LTTKNVEDFTKRFNRPYHKITIPIQPIEIVAMVAYSTAFDAYFSITLREKRSTTLLIMQANAVALKGNLMAEGKVKIIGLHGIDEKKKDNKDKEK